jgi:hypothetical protein
MTLFAVLGLLAWQTLSDEKIRLVTLVILAGFAVRTLAHRHHAGIATGNDSEQEPM